MALGSSAPAEIEPHVRAYKENVKNADPVGGFVNDQWASSTLGICLEDNREARELGARSLKTFFGPDKPYTQQRKEVYEQLLDQWGGVPDHLKSDFDRKLGLDVDAARDDSPESLDLTGGATASAQAIIDEMDADTLADRAVTITGDPNSCIEALEKHEATGIDQMMIMMQTETVPHEKVMKSIELFGKYVIPEFKKSEEEAVKAV